MTESYVGKTSCYDICPISHQCFGGYLNYNEVCQAEFDRMRDALAVEFPRQQISLQAQSGKGIYFTRGDEFICVVQNELGVWVKRDKAIYFSR